MEMENNLIEPKILVGKNATDNWRIYKESSQMDTIFHLDKFPSPYVIIDVPVDKLTNSQIYQIANLCKSKSKHRCALNISVLYTSVSNTVLGKTVGSFIIISHHKKKITYV